MSRRFVQGAVIAAVWLALPAATAEAKLAFKTKDYPLAYAPGDVVIADFDGKRGDDIAIPDASGAGDVQIFLNKGNGTFAKTSKPGCAGAHELAAGPIDGGKPDLLVVCAPVANPQAVSLLGNGSGGFGAPKPAGIGASPGDFELGYLNETHPPNGAVDAAFEGYGNNNTSVLCHAYGKKNGTFDQASRCAQDPTTLYFQPIYGDIGLADLSGDRKLEAMSFTSDSANESIAVFRFDVGDFPLTGFDPFPSLRRTGSTYGRAIYASDLDRDGDLDIVTGESAGKIGVFKWGKHGIPNGSTAKLYGTVTLDDMALGDFNGDHFPDAAAVRSATGTASSSAVAITLGKGNTAFAAAKKFPAGVDLASHHIAVGDLNRDGRDDVAVTSYTGELTILLSK